MVIVHLLSDFIIVVQHGNMPGHGFDSLSRSWASYSHTRTSVISSIIWYYHKLVSKRQVPEGTVPHVQDIVNGSGQWVKGLHISTAGLRELGLVHCWLKE